MLRYKHTSPPHVGAGAMRSCRSIGLSDYFLACAITWPLSFTYSSLFCFLAISTPSVAVAIAPALSPAFNWISAFQYLMYGAGFGDLSASFAHSSAFWISLSFL